MVRIFQGQNKKGKCLNLLSGEQKNEKFSVVTLGSPTTCALFSAIAYLLMLTKLQSYFTENIYFSNITGQKKQITY